MAGESLENVVDKHLGFVPTSRVAPTTISQRRNVGSTHPPASAGSGAAAPALVQGEAATGVVTPSQ